MTWVVKIPLNPMVRYLFMVETLPSEEATSLQGPGDWAIEEGGRVEVVPDFGEWPYGTKAPQTTVCQALEDPKYYKVFNRPSDVPLDQFQVTGLNWGGFHSRKGWDRYVGQGLAAMLEFSKIPDTDPPGAMEEVMRAIRRGA